MIENSWKEKVERAIEDGAEVVAPNGYPIMYLTGTNKAMEAGDADHKNYIKPMMVQYIGDMPTDVEIPSRRYAGIHHFQASTESHSLVFNDGCCALTIYERCYFMWMRDRTQMDKEVFIPHKTKNATYEIGKFILREYTEEEKLPYWERDVYNKTDDNE